MVRYSAGLCLLLCLNVISPQLAARAQTPMPPDYRGPQVRIFGIFITPVPYAPFVADVDIISHQKLPDGTEHITMTVNHIARDSGGRIYNERRSLVPTSFRGEPRLLEGHIYDPNTRLNTFFDPLTHIARQAILAKPPTPPANSVPGRPDPSSKVVDLGEQFIDGTRLTGTEKQHIIPAAASGTGQPVTITDQYWYSPDLSVYFVVKHDDPRTGEQIVAVRHIERHEPEAVRLAVPPDYKIVDETPVPRNGAMTP
jgi:hypothetical protein